ncbi:hypothetical protein Tco_1153339 [Tanacetum coccineum]
MTHPHPNRRFVPQAVLTKSEKINTAGANVNNAVRPVNTAVRLVNTAGSKTTVNHLRPISNAYKKGYSQVTRPFNKSVIPDTSLCEVSKAWSLSRKDGMCRDESRYMG